ncbi:hypothetical protein Goshw_026263, partial [Gossypium schwendimanii]|nr:hypothetical protein [Gossypium schwendimanii]
MRSSSLYSYREIYSPELNSLLNRELVMENRFLDKVEDNVAVGYSPRRHNKRRARVDLVPIAEEYITLLCCPRIQADKACSRA